MSGDAAFTLDARLEADAQRIGDLPFARVLLMNDARFPWLILVPRANAIRELIDLSQNDQRRLLDDISHAANALRALEKPDKLNIAMLGNVVPQLHVHVVARFIKDAAWPKPVWSVGERTPYGTHELNRYAEEIAGALKI